MVTHFRHKKGNLLGLSITIGGKLQAGGYEVVLSGKCIYVLQKGTEKDLQARFDCVVLNYKKLRKGFCHD